MRTVESHHVCAYCSTRRPKCELTSVAHAKEVRQKWMDILGAKFKEACGLWTRPKICLSHFELVNGKRKYSSLPKPLPFFDPSFQKENRRNEKNNIVKTFVLQEPDIPEVSTVEETEPKSEPKITYYSNCCYCGARAKRNMMCQVPRDDVQLVEWGRILGSVFLCKATQVSNGRICRTHFDLKYGGGLRIRGQLPIPDPKISGSENIVVNKKEKGSSQKTEVNIEDEMEMKPSTSDLNLVIKLEDEEKMEMSTIHEHSGSSCQELEDGEQNSVEPTSIVKEEEECWIEDEVEVKPRTIDEQTNRVSCDESLDFEMEEEEQNLASTSMIKEEEEKNECYITEVKVEDEMEVKPNTSGEPIFHHEEQNIKIELEDEEEEMGMSTLGEHVKADYERFRVNRSYIFTKAIQQRCCFCGCVGDMRSMYITPSNERIILEWAEILGSEFVFIATSQPHSFVCRKHLGSAKACCYCALTRPIMEMKWVPKDRELRREWSRILGVNFEKLVAVQDYSLICMSHFEHIGKNSEYRNELPRPLPFCNDSMRKNETEKEKLRSKIRKVYQSPTIEVEEETSEPEPEPEPYTGKPQTCFICQTLQKKVTPLPTELEDVVRWSKVFREFPIVREFLKSKKLFICTEHVEKERWQLYPKKRKRVM